jgi:hypothetical protein
MIRITVSILFLLLLSLITLPNLGFSIHESSFNTSNSSSIIGLPDTDVSDTLAEMRQKEQQELSNRTLLQQQQNWSAYND